MATILMKDSINKSADDVWNIIKDFNGLPGYCAAFRKSSIKGAGVGALRTVTTQDGAEIVERLDKISETEKSLSYSIVSSPLPLENYSSTMKVSQLGEKVCELEWHCSFEPKGAPENDLKQLIEGVYSSAFEGLKKL